MASKTWRVPVEYVRVSGGRLPSRCCPSRRQRSNTWPRTHRACVRVRRVPDCSVGISCLHRIQRHTRQQPGAAAGAIVGPGSEGSRGRVRRCSQRRRAHGANGVSGEARTLSLLARAEHGRTRRAAPPASMEAYSRARLGSGTVQSGAGRGRTVFVIVPYVRPVPRPEDGCAGSGTKLRYSACARALHSRP